MCLFQAVVKTFERPRKHSIFITASEIWSTPLLKLNSTMSVFSRGFTNHATAVISRNTLEWLLLC